MEASPSHRPLRAGLLLVGLLLIGANLRAAITVVGPLIGDVRADLGLSAVTASALISLPLICFGLFSPIAPKLAARLGLEQTIGWSLVALSAGILLRSMPGLVSLWAGTVLLGMAVAFMNVLLPAIIKRDFSQDTGRVTGAYSAMQSTFAALASIVAVPVAGLTDSGWRLSFGIFAGLAVIGLAMFFPQIARVRSERAAARSFAEVTPASVTNPTSASAAVGSAPDTAGTTKADQGRATSAKERERSIWASPRAWMITVSMGLQSVVFFVVVTWLPAIEVDSGISQAAAGLHLGVLLFCGIAGNIIAAAVIQRFPADQRGLIVGFVVFASASIGGILLLPSFAEVWAVVLGLSTGGFIVFSLAAFGLRTRSHERAGELSGMAQSVGYLLAAAGPLVIGALHDATGDWTVPLLVLLVMQIPQLATAWVAASPKYVD